jgi:hypothetical protein
LDLFHHFKSLHGTSYPQQIPPAVTKPCPKSVEAHCWRQRLDGIRFARIGARLTTAPAPLTRAGLLLGTGSQDGRFDVNAVKRKGGIENMETFILDKIKALGLKKWYPTLPITKTNDEERVGSRSQGIIPEPIDFEE